MPDIKILLFIGLIIFQLIRYLAKNAAPKDSNKAPGPTPSTLAEMIEKMNQQPNTSPKTLQKQGSIMPKKRPPIIVSEIDEERPEQVQKKFKNQQSMELINNSYMNYEQHKPVLSAEDKKHFEGYADPTPKINYLEKIRNPQTFRDAFVINEILNPKYI